MKIPTCGLLAGMLSLLALAACAAAHPASPEQSGTVPAHYPLGASYVALKTVLWDATSAQGRRTQYTTNVDSLKLFPTPGVLVRLLLDTVAVDLISFSSAFRDESFMQDTTVLTPGDTAMLEVWADTMTVYTDDAAERQSPAPTSGQNSDLEEVSPRLEERAAYLMVVSDSAAGFICVTAQGPVVPRRAPRLQEVADVDDGVVCGPAASAAGATRAPAEIARRDLIDLVVAQEGARAPAWGYNPYTSPGAYAGALSGVPGFHASNGVRVEVLGGSLTGWSATALHEAAPGVRCIVWVGAAGRVLAARNSLHIGERGRPWCGPDTRREAVTEAQLATLRSELQRLVVLQEAAAARFEGYTASPIRLRQLGITALEGYGVFRMSEHALVRIAEATPQAWAAEAVHDSVTGTVCRVRVGPVSGWTAESVIALPEGQAICSPGTLSDRLPTVDPLEAMRTALLSYLQPMEVRAECESDLEHSCLDPRVRVRILQQDTASFAAEAVHGDLPQFSCVLSLGAVQRQVVTQRDTLVAEQGEVVCDGDISTGAPESARLAQRAMKGDLRRLIAVHRQAREADSTSYVPSMERLTRAGFQPTPGVELRMLSVHAVDGESAFSVEARYPAMLPGKSCVVYVLEGFDAELALPATLETGKVPDLPGVPSCDRP